MAVNSKVNERVRMANRALRDFHAKPAEAIAPLWGSPPEEAASAAQPLMLLVKQRRL